MSNKETTLENKNDEKQHNRGEKRSPGISTETLQMQKKAPIIRAEYGKLAETSFLVGSTALLEELDSAISELAKLPRGTHIGTLKRELLCTHLPEQFATRYDYEFLYAMRAELRVLVAYACERSNTTFCLHSVMDEILLYMIVNIANSKFEIMGTEEFLNMECEDSDLPDSKELGNDNEEEREPLEEAVVDWVFDLFGDEDVMILLYNPAISLQNDHSYHFDNWFKNQLYMSDPALED